VGRSPLADQWGSRKEKSEELVTTNAELENEKHHLLEEQIKSQKLLSLGILAGGIAHDFNNLLMAIGGSVTLARRIVRNCEVLEIDPLLEEGERAFWKARDLTQQLLTYSKGGAPVKKAASVHEIVRDSAAFSMHGSNVHREIDLPDELWPVEVDAGQIGQIVQNLVINASQARPRGGTIRISAQNVDSRDLDDSRLEALGAGRFVRIRVRDEGHGIPAQEPSKILDPYYTTKSKGSGLGLAISYSVIERHGGERVARSTS